MNTISYRYMTEEDLEDILEIEISSNPHPWTEKNFLDCIQRDYYCLIQEFNQKISGFAIQSTSLEEAHLLNIGIKEKFRRKGLGVDILNQVIIFSESISCRRVFLEVRVSNTKAISLYEKEGFQKVDIRKNYYRLGDGREDALIMTKKLKKDWKDFIYRRLV